MGCATSTPPAIQEMIDASAAEVSIDPDARVESMMALEAAAETALVPSNGPLHYYAPAPDVPSIEHRKLSPNPLPQMPLLITLAHAEAGTAQYSFSPQADQSRIIGNGVRELKEFLPLSCRPPSSSPPSPTWWRASWKSAMTPGTWWKKPKLRCVKRLPGSIWTSCRSQSLQRQPE